MSAPYTVSKVLQDERIRHGFFGREGGRSKGDFAGNNMSISQGDNPDWPSLSGKFRCAA